MRSLTKNELPAVSGGMSVEHLAEASATLGTFAALTGAEPVAAAAFGFAFGLEMCLALD